jgi:hypothetical protein
MTTDSKQFTSELTETQKRGQKYFLRSKGINPDQPIQLSLLIPIVYGSQRMQPNDTVRSALFTARNDKVKRENLKKYEIFTPDPTVKILYSGEELRSSSDELIWMQLIEYAKHANIGEKITINIHKICLDLKWSPNPKYYSIVRNSLERLDQGKLKVISEKHGKAVYMPMIILHCSDERITREATQFTFSIHSDLTLLVAGQTVTHLEWNKLKKLSPLQQRLYGYVASHKNPEPLNILAFHKMCSSLNKNLPSFKQEIKKAIKKLIELELLVDGWIELNLIHLKKSKQA